MSIYSPKMVPIDSAQLSQFLKSELEEIARAKAEPDPFVTLDTLYSAPSKLRNGMIVLADGTSWNPGSGAGFYGYRNGAWHLLG